MFFVSDVWGLSNKLENRLLIIIKWFGQNVNHISGIFPEKAKKTEKVLSRFPPLTLQLSRSPGHNSYCPFREPIPERT